MLELGALIGGVLAGGLGVLGVQRLRRDRASPVAQNAVVSLVLDSVDAAITVYNAQGRLIRANRCAQRLSGFTEAELCDPETWKQIIPPEDFSGVMNFLNKPKLSDS